MLLLTHHTIEYNGLEHKIVFKRDPVSIAVSLPTAVGWELRWLETLGYKTVALEQLAVRVTLVKSDGRQRIRPRIVEKDPVAKI